MVITKEQLLDKLPIREYWLSKEIASAFEVTIRTVQYAAKRHDIGMKVRQGPKGTYVFTKDDLDKLLTHIHGEVGNPVSIKMSRERLSHYAKVIKRSMDNAK